MTASSAQRGCATAGARKRGGATGSAPGRGAAPRGARDDARSRALRDALAATGCEALLVVGASTLDPDLAPFVGSARLGECFVLVHAGGACWLGYHSAIEREEAAATGLPLLDPVTLGVAAPVSGGPGARLARSLSTALRHAAIAGGRLALAGRYPNGELASALARLRRDGFGFVSGHDAVLRLRRPKSAVELEEVREVARGTSRAFHRVAAILREAAIPGRSGARRGRGRLGTKSRPQSRAPLRYRGEPLTVAVLRRAVAEELAAAGLEQPEGNLIAPGREGAVPHNTGDPASPIRSGESLVVDLFPRRRLHADCTRTFCVGPAPEALAGAHAAVLRALELARSSARPGVAGHSIQEQVCGHFERLGYGTVLGDPSVAAGYVHGLGHGVGFEVHELPHFRRPGRGDQGAGVLESGDVFTLEPGLYDPAAGWAVRLEDLFVLDRGGLESLTALPYDLDPSHWPAEVAP